MNKVLFHSNQLGGRGTEVNLYDLAFYNQTILNNISYVSAPANSEMTTFSKFSETFGDNLFLYNDFQSLIDYVKDNNITHVYWIKSGENDGKLIPDVKNFVHCVFTCSQPHGDVYVAVSKWLGDRYNRDHMNHIVSLPDVKENYRSVLGIPEDALVVGRHGGYDQLSIPYVPDAIIDAVHRRMNIYFLLMNTKPFDYQHDRIIYLSPEYDVYSKTAFINTCDYGLTGRTDGESFGLSIAEYLHQNKPVITNIDGRDRNHVNMLGPKGYYYSTKEELVAILTFATRDKNDYKHLVSEFSPKQVMNKFKTIFLDR